MLPPSFNPPHPTNTEEVTPLKKYANDLHIYTTDFKQQPQSYIYKPHPGAT